MSDLLPERWPLAREIASIAAICTCSLPGFVCQQSNEDLLWMSTQLTAEVRRPDCQWYRRRTSRTESWLSRDECGAQQQGPEWCHDWYNCL